MGEPTSRPAPERPGESGPHEDVLLRVKSLRVTYPSRGERMVAVSDVSVDLRRSEVVAIVGESGSGKSTLVRAVAGLLPPQAVATGTVEFAGAGRYYDDVLGLGEKELRRLRGSIVGFVPQSTFGALNPVISVRRQFHMTLRRDGLRPAKREARAFAALADAGVRDVDTVWRAFPHELSGGLAQRVIFALAICRRPRFLLADEPTTALDVVVQADVLTRLRRSVDANSSGALLVTHDLGVAAEYADRVVVMRAGRDVERGPVKSVIENPQHPYTQSLLEAGLGRGAELLAPAKDSQAGSAAARPTIGAGAPGTGEDHAQRREAWLRIGRDHYVRISDDHVGESTIDASGAQEASRR